METKTIKSRFNNLITFKKWNDGMLVETDGHNYIIEVSDAIAIAKAIMSWFGPAQEVEPIGSDW